MNSTIQSRFVCGQKRRDAAIVHASPLLRSGKNLSGSFPGFCRRLSRCPCPRRSPCFCNRSRSRVCRLPAMSSVLFSYVFCVSGTGAGAFPISPCYPFAKLVLVRIIGSIKCLLLPPNIRQESESDKFEVTPRARSERSADGLRPGC